MMIGKKIVKTPMLKSYLIKFMIRIAIFMIIAVIYITDKPLLCTLMTKPVWLSITLGHILWFMFMVMMFRHIFPTKKSSMAIRKAKKEQYLEQENYLENGLFKYVQDQNVKAWKVLILWLSFNAIFGILYLFDVMDDADMFMLTVFYFLCDYICILLFCPFQSGIMKNRCCVNCRIFDWGHFMMFTPMLFVRNFFSLSLFFTSCIVLVKWEIAYAKHPERFWSGSNKKLQCANCNDKICQIKSVLLEK